MSIHLLGGILNWSSTTCLFVLVLYIIQTVFVPIFTNLSESALAKCKADQKEYMHDVYKPRMKLSKLLFSLKPIGIEKHMHTNIITLIF